jgi:hypothetical protein
MKIIPVLFFLSFINAQIALPTFQGVHKPHASAFESTDLTFSYTGSIETFVVPSGVTSITIEAWGAGGASPTSVVYTPGKGARLKGTFTVTPSDVILILVGQNPNNQGGGGGGTFIVEVDNNSSYTMNTGAKVTPLLVAGGGAGGTNHSGTDNPNKDAVLTTSGATSDLFAGGTDGSGGTTGGQGCQPAAGGGFLSAGQNGSCSANGGSSFLSGGAGGTGTNSINFGPGGFGCGGAGNIHRSGAGGGYSGGGAGLNPPPTRYGPSAGGGSYNSGSNQSNSVGVQEGNGQVILSY